ncbi:hypothetical protein OAU52_00080 [bacterium]|nr:hypothetical protein [bacterium]
MIKKINLAIKGLMVLSAVSMAAEKKVFLEYIGYPACPPCPGGHVMMERAIEEHGSDKIVHLSHEGGPMYTDWQVGWFEYFAMGSERPRMTIDREQGEGQALYIEDSLTYKQTIEDQLKKPAFVSLDIHHQFDQITGTIEGYVEVVFEKDTILTSPKITLILAEDSVHSTQDAYTQKNSWSRVPGFPELQGKGSMKDYKYPMVERSFIIGLPRVDTDIKYSLNEADSIYNQNRWKYILALDSVNNANEMGLTDLLKDTVQAGEVYKLPFFYQVPAKFESLTPVYDMLELIVLVTDHGQGGHTDFFGNEYSYSMNRTLNVNSIKVVDDQIDFEMPSDTTTYLREVEYSKEMQELRAALGIITPIFTKSQQAFQTKFNISNEGQISFETSRSQEFTLEIYSVNGNKIFSQQFSGGQKKYSLSKSFNNSGINIISLKSNEGIENLKFNVLKGL